jgi:hypothetical protein
MENKTIIYKEGRTLIIKTTCDYCNKEFIFTRGLSIFNNCKKHYCDRKCKFNGQITHNLTNSQAGVDGRYKMLLSAKHRTEKSGVIFNLTIDDIPEVPEYCPLFNIKIFRSVSRYQCDNSPSLDRIIPSLGYVKGNVRIISNRANRLKNNGSSEEFEILYRDALKIEKVKEELGLI